MNAKQLWFYVVRINGVEIAKCPDNEAVEAVLDREAKRHAKGANASVIGFSRAEFYRLESQVSDTGAIENVWTGI